MTLQKRIIAMIDRSIEKLEQSLISARKKSGRPAEDHVLFIFDIQRDSAVFPLAVGLITRQQHDEARRSETVDYVIVGVSRDRAAALTELFKSIMKNANEGEESDWKDITLTDPKDIPPGHTLIVVLTAGSDDEKAEDYGGMAFYCQTRLLLT